MSHESKIHPAQTHILRELLFLPEANFAKLQKPTSLDADHFKFHINRLIEIGYVKKVSHGTYTLTQKGKEYANKLDTDQNSIERQPKSAVILVLQKGDTLLVQERLKHPYFGFWGFPGGKIRWGETIIEAGERELLEETGLRTTLSYRGVYHEHVIDKESKELLEDKIFHVLHGVIENNTLKETFEGGRNAWLRIDEINKLTKKYVSFDLEKQVGLGEIEFVEKTQYYSKQEF